MLKQLFSKINTLGYLYRLGGVLALSDVFALKRMKRYQPGQVKSKQGLIEYVDSVSLLSDLKEIFVD